MAWWRRPRRRRRRLPCLGAAIEEVLKAPEHPRENFLALGSTPAEPAGPLAFAPILKNEEAKWPDVVRASGAKGAIAHGDGRSFETQTRPRRPRRDRSRRAAHRAADRLGPRPRVGDAGHDQPDGGCGARRGRESDPAGHQSLGTHLDVRHIAATPVGMRVARDSEASRRGRPHPESSGSKRTTRRILIGDGAHTRLVRQRRAVRSARASQA